MTAGRISSPQTQLAAPKAAIVAAMATNHFAICFISLPGLCTPSTRSADCHSAATTVRRNADQTVTASFH